MEEEVGQVSEPLPPLRSTWQGVVSAAVVLVLWPWLALTGAFQLGDKTQASRSVLSRVIDLIRSLLGQRSPRDVAGR